MGPGIGMTEITKDLVDEGRRVLKENGTGFRHRLRGETRPIDRVLVQPHRRPGFQPEHLQLQPAQAFTERCGRGLVGPSGRV